MFDHSGSNQMKDLDKLQHSYMMHKLGVGDLSDAIDWAMDRLRLDEEGDDLEVVLLAGATDADEASPYVEIIVRRYCDQSMLDDHLAAGKYVVILHNKYVAGTESVDSLDATFDKLSYRLGHPDWLTMLSRNCEYATDIFAFRQPFEQEFQYIAELWTRASSREEFDNIYSRETSNQHDVK